MPEYILLMHEDADGDKSGWEPYLSGLKYAGVFEGGSAIGDGECVRKSGAVPSLTAYLAGYIAVNADNPDHAKAMLAGNPHFKEPSKSASCRGAGRRRLASLRGAIATKQSRSRLHEALDSARNDGKPTPPAFLASPARTWP